MAPIYKRLPPLSSLGKDKIVYMAGPYQLKYYTTENPHFKILFFFGSICGPSIAAKTDLNIPSSLFDTVHPQYLYLCNLSLCSIIEGPLTGILPIFI